jgi:hypothetical protein
MPSYLIKTSSAWLDLLLACSSGSRSSHPARGSGNSFMRTPREESMSVSTEEGEASERIVSEMIIFSFKFAFFGSVFYLKLEKGCISRPTYCLISHSLVDRVLVGQPIRPNNHGAATYLVFMYNMLQCYITRLCTTHARPVIHSNCARHMLDL